jgi:hypothetical protein
VADADGTVVTFPYQTAGVYAPATIEDRNGNVVTLNTESSFPFRLTSYTDTLGRSALSISYGDQPNTSHTDTITVSGLSQPYSAIWNGSATVTNTNLNVNQYSGSCSLAGVNQAVYPLSALELARNINSPTTRLTGC